MTRRQFAVLLLCTFMIPVGGCANKDAVLKDEPEAATLRTGQTSAPATAAPRGKLTNAIAAIVNDEVVTLNEINREAQPFIREAEKQAPLDDTARSQIRRSALERVVEKKLVEQKIKELNIKVTDEEIRQAIDDVKKQNNIPSQEAFVAALASQGLSYELYRTQLQEQIEKLKLVSVEVRAKIHVSETELREFYDSNRSKYTEDESYRARHIFFKTNEKSGAEDIKLSMKNALMVLAEARSGKDFTELAKTYSEDPAARKDGGDLGLFKKGDMQPELEAAIITMKPGEISELVYTPVGFHIIKLEERISGKLKPFEGLKAEIEEAVYKKKSEERFSQWAKDLRAKATIEIKDLKGLL
jgi:peptidyl-prolyl cis-trans isomerase SurA